MFLLYNLLLTIFSPFWVPWMWWRARQRAEAPNWKERTGNFTLPKKERPRIWFHAVSVGEVVASIPVLHAIREAWPQAEIVLSVTTSSGHKTATDRLTGLYDHLIYFPIDVARFALASVGRVKPDVVVIMETELWMNFLWAAKVWDARTLLVNGRISDRSYPRARRLKFFYRALLKMVDRCLMQTPQDMERILDLGAASAEVVGNCKFDQALDTPTTALAGLNLDPQKLTIVIGSTRGVEEEEFVVAALAKLDPRLERIQVLHAPRHIETAPGLAARARRTFGACALRSLGETGAYLVLDTYGELAAAYRSADIAVIGGGFENLGGQNLVQPLALGIPVVHGPHMQNFRDVAESARRVGATRVCATADDLAATLDELLNSPSERLEMGRAGHQLIQSGAGASQRIAQAIVAESERGRPVR
ncbi:MAG: 3-deoxy-D-manno-octulosonic acid transferase [Fimbriimonas sp.]